MEFSNLRVRQHTVIKGRIGDVNVLVLAAVVAEEDEEPAFHRNLRPLRRFTKLLCAIDKADCCVRRPVVRKYNAHPFIWLDSRRGSRASLVAERYDIGRRALNPPRSVRIVLSLQKSVVVVYLVCVVWYEQIHHHGVAAVVREVVVALEAVVHAHVDVAIAGDDAVRSFREIGGTGARELLEVVADRRLRDVPGGKRPLARQPRLRVVRKFRFVNARFVVELHIINVEQFVFAAFVCAKKDVVLIEIRKRIAVVPGLALVRLVQEKVPP